MSTAVCDSGPLTHLWQIDMWPVLGIFEGLYVPEQVIVEVQEHVDIDRLAQLCQCTVIRHQATQVRTLSSYNLEETDVAVLQLAREIQPDYVLTDDLALRKALESEDFLVMGSVGILLGGCKRAILGKDELLQAIDGLFVHATLYLSPKFRSYVDNLIRETLANE